MRILIALLLCVPTVAQQAPPPPPMEIHGVVTEVGANSPISEAAITVEALPNHPVPVGDLKQVAKTVSDMQGAFRIVLDEPGN